MHIPELAVAVGTAEAADVKHLLVGKEPFHGVHSLLTPNTGFLHWQLEFLQGEEKVRSLENTSAAGDLAWVPAQLPELSEMQNSLSLMMLQQGLVGSKKRQQAHGIAVA